MTRRAKPEKKQDKLLRLHGLVARTLGVAIVSGKYPPGSVLEREVNACVQFDVSRTVYREAVRMLAAKGLVESRPRVGTRVSPRAQWQLLDPDVLAWIFSSDPDPGVLQSLFELRRIVEPAAAELAAKRRSQRQLDAMYEGLQGMRTHKLHTEAGVQADVKFHAALLEATGNAFILSLASGVTAAIATLDDYKQRWQPLRRDPTPDHERVYNAIAAKDPEAARQAMLDLLRLAIADTRRQERAARKPKRTPRRS